MSVLVLHGYLEFVEISLLPAAVFGLSVRDTLCLLGLQEGMTRCQVS